MSDDTGYLKIIETSHNPLPKESLFKIKTDNGKQISSLTDYKGRVCCFDVFEMNEPQGYFRQASLGVGINLEIAWNPASLITPGSVLGPIVGASSASASSVQLFQRAGFRFMNRSEELQPCTLDIGDIDSNKVTMSWDDSTQKYFWKADIVSSTDFDPRYDAYVERGKIIATPPPADECMIFRIDTNSTMPIINIQKMFIC